VINSTGGRPARGSATRGRGGRRAGTEHGPTGAGPLRQAYGGVRRSARGQTGAGATSRSSATRCGAGYFDHVLLPKFELKCTE
jgi:hypothetical protein